MGFNFIEIKVVKKCSCCVTFYYKFKLCKMIAVSTEFNMLLYLTMYYIKVVDNP